MLSSGLPEAAVTYFSTTTGFANLLLIISGAIFTGDAVSSEFEHKTGLLLFPTPQGRTTIFIGKYVAALAATLGSVLLYYLCNMVFVSLSYGVGAISTEMLQSLGVAVLYGTSVVSVMYFFSSVIKRTISSTLIGFFLLLMIMPILSAVLSLVSIDPWFLLTYNADLISSVLNTVTVSFGPGKDAGATFSPELYTGLAVMAVYALAGVVAGTAIAIRNRMD